MDSKKIATELLAQLTPENIIGLQHCATRLRFRLKKEEGVDEQAISDIQGVLSVVRKGGQWQVVIGPGVADVYRHLNDALHITDAAPRLNKGQAGTKLQDVIFNYISGSLQPFLPVLAGGGIIKGFTTLLVAMTWLSVDSGTYHILNAVGDSVFYFLPIILGFSAAKALNSNPYLGAVIGAAMIHPSILQMAGVEGVTHWHFLGLPFIPMNYANSVLPILVGMAIFAPFERFLNKVMPKSLAIILVSTTAMLVMIPLMITLFGPALHYTSAAIAGIIEFLLAKAPLLAGALVGATWFLLVTIGLHWGLIPLAYIQNDLLGYSSLMPLFWISTMAQIGVALAMVIKNQNQDFRNLIRPSIGVAFLAGITEPIIYGVILKYRKSIPIVIISGALGGALTALFHINAIPAGLGGVLSWAGFAGVNSSLNIILAIIIQLATMFLSFMLTLIWGTKNH